MDAEKKLLEKTGLDYEMLDAGCCGMAGYFGYEKGLHYKVGLAAGERVLLPAVRKAAKETLIIADGFSCREQIEQGTDRQALHLAQVLQMGLRERGKKEPRPYPEKEYVSGMKLKKPPESAKVVIALVGAAALLASFILIRKKMKHHFKHNIQET